MNVDSSPIPTRRRLAPLSAPDDLPAVADKTWLLTGAEGPPLAAQHVALENYLRHRSLGAPGRAAHSEVERRLRDHLADLLGLRTADVALVSNASEAINLIAMSTNLRPGDNVVLNDLEFPSMIQPWLRLSASGVEVRIARHEAWRLPADTIGELVDRRTRVVAVSHVSYLSGWRHDIAALSTIAHEVGATLVLDATQSLGVVPVPADLVDAVVSSSYKWLLGGHGLGVLAWNQQRSPLPQPSAVGWRSVSDLFADDRLERYTIHTDARRFEVGFPSYPSIYALEASVAWLRTFDPIAIEQHVLSLGRRLIAELDRRGWSLLTVADPDHRAGNIAVSAPAGEQVAAHLAERGIHCWGGDDRLRFSLHLFNGDDDIDRLIAGLEAFADPDQSDDLGMPTTPGAHDDEKS